MLKFEPQIITEVIHLTAALEDCQSRGHTASIALSRVLAWAWAPGRLERCRERLAAGERAPAIEVSRYLLQGDAYYTVSDGRHRATAAREAGHTRIRARIGSECRCEPGKCWLDTQSGSLWREQPGKGWLTLVSVGTLSPEVQQALLSVGVRVLR